MRIFASALLVTAALTAMTPKAHALNAVDVRVFGASTSASDNATALNAAFSFAGNAQIIFPCGTFQVASPLTVSVNNSWIEGVSSVGTGGGTGCTTIESTSATADLIDISPGVTAYYLGWLNLDRTVTATGGAGLSVGAGAAGTIDHVQAIDQFTGFSLGATNLSFCNYCVAMNNFSDGFSITNTTPIPQMQWGLSHTLAQFNDGAGYVMDATGTSLGPSFDFSGSFQNSGGGFLFTGSGTANDVELVNVVGSTDGGNEIYFSNPGNNIVITNPFLELAGRETTGRGSATPASGLGAGILCDTSGTATSLLAITGGIIQNNSKGGLVVNSNSNLANLTVSGTVFTDNGSTGSQYGIFLDNAATVFLTGITSNNQTGSSNQLYGLDMSNAGDVWVSGGNFVPNVTAGCNTTILGGKAVVSGSGC